MARQRPTNADPTPGRWTHRLAWTLLCATFALIYVGGTVTTYKAGMAVPDWPTTRGHWLFPIQNWLTGTWGLFLEHGHRMLAQLVGLIAIALAVTLRRDPRRPMRWLGLAAVAAVILQGVIGGLRVIFELQGLAMLHGCTGPLFLGLCVALVSLTSRRWLAGAKPRRHAAARRLHRFTSIAAVALYAQIVLGAQLRHLAAGAWPGWFELCVWVKLIAAGLILVGLVWLLAWTARRLDGPPVILRRVRWLVVLFSVQVVLGAGAWITKYNWPAWFSDYIWPVEYTVVAAGRLQVLVTTIHAAGGSLVLVTAVSLLLWSRRLVRDDHANSPA